MMSNVTFQQIQQSSYNFSNITGSSGNIAGLLKLLKCDSDELRMSYLQESY
jgi:hypothetical protein